jgi:predicted ATPase
LRKAIEIAQGQESRWWELRATMSLARLLAEQGRRDEARAMLAEIYGWLTEGFGTRPEGRQGIAGGVVGAPHLG